MELKFSNNLDSAKRLDEIMNSYSGRDCGSIMADERSLVVMLTLLEHGKIVVTEHTYPYDRDIQSNSGMMDLYAELARETRWRRFGHTEIERIRLNALRQMRQEGRPSYDEEFICYRQGRICVHCGNIRLPELLLYLAMSRQSGSFFSPTRTGQRIRRRNTIALTCLKPPSQARGSIVSPSGTRR